MFDVFLVFIVTAMFCVGSTHIYIIFDFMFHLINVSILVISSRFMLLACWMISAIVQHPLFMSRLPRVVCLADTRTNPSSEQMGGGPCVLCHQHVFSCRS